MQVSDSCCYLRCFCASVVCFRQFFLYRLGKDLGAALQVVHQTLFFRQLVYRLCDETTLLEPLRRYRGEYEEPLDADGAGARLDALQQLFAVAPAPVIRMYGDAGQFSLVVAVRIERGAADDQAIVLDD